MIGQQIQNYLVTTHLGEGGMGTVFKATDEVLGRDVALKMLHTPLVNQTQFLERFKKEARILAKLLHPNIAVIYNFIEQDSRHFMVMEYVEGYNLDQLLHQKQKLSYRLIVPLLLQALEGLHHAHKKDICHRDIKPANLIMTPDGTVKLMDFGIAKIAGEQRLTQVARVIGTLEYMAPELIEGKDASVATDIYSLGVTAYELLTGKLPFSGSTDFNVMQDILKKAPLTPDKLEGSIPKALCEIIVKALRKKPTERFTSAKDFQLALTSAFPALTSIDIAAFKEETPATRLIETAGATRVEFAGTMLQELSTKTARVPYLLQSIRQGLVRQSRKQLLLAGSILLMFVVVAVVITSNRNSIPEPAKKDQAIAAISLPVDAQRKPVADDETGLPAVNLVSANPVRVPADDETLKSGTGNQNSNDKKLSPVKERKSSIKSPVVNKTSVSDKATTEAEITSTEDEPQPAPAIKSEKYVYIKAKLKVVMTLSGNIDPDKARAGQSLNFKVSSPVYYQGETIIEAGAAAEGRITFINNRKMVMVLTNVQAVNGQKVFFEEDELGGKPDKVLSRRNFTGIIKKGLSLVL